MSQTKTLKKIVDDKYTVKQLEEKLDDREIDYQSSKNKPHKVEKFAEEYLNEDEKENLLTKEVKEVDKDEGENGTISNDEEEENEEENDDYPDKPYWMAQEVYEKKKENNEPLTEKHAED